MTDEEIAKIAALSAKVGTDVDLWPDIPGRNDPCLCGSGVKYKKCCQSLLEKEEAEYDCGNV